MKHEGEEITDGICNLDDDEFVGCELTRCLLIWTGKKPLHLTGNDVTECQFQFHGPAGNTIAALRALYHGGFKDLIENTIEAIRAPEEK